MLSLARGVEYHVLDVLCVYIMRIACGVMSIGRNKAYTRPSRSAEGPETLPSLSGGALAGGPEAQVRRGVVMARQEPAQVACPIRTHDATCGTPSGPAGEARIRAVHAPVALGCGAV